MLVRRRGRRGEVPRRRRGRGRGREVVGAAPGVVGPGRLHRRPAGAGAGGGPRPGCGEEAVRGADGGEGAAAAAADDGDGELPRRHVPLRHRVPPRLRPAR
uniref:Uncharacterized protein n=1 Tax=Triticum urartu TaxID=4572 RepID=A0A8R7TSQ5_TRIUA